MTQQACRPLVPEFILRNHAEGVYHGDFHAAAMFVDLSGFSAMTDQLMTYGDYGAEVLAELMRAIFEPLIQAVYEQDGFVATTAGDAFTALFPVEGAAQTPCLRALAAAWKIQSYMQAHPTHSASGFAPFQISAKVGLAYGDIQWGILSSGDNRRSIYYFQGTAVDACAHAEHHAQAGEIITGEDFLAQVTGWCEAAPTGHHYKILHVKPDLPKPVVVHEPSVDPSVMGRFFPEALITETYSGEFRQVVNVFIRLPTVRTEAQLSIFVESLFALQEKYGGLLLRLDFGDKGSNLLLFWGAPAAHENDVERALNFILDLQVITSIPINAGITYRVAHAGFVGSRFRQDFTCFGRGVNLAARLMTTAGQGEIWLDEPVALKAQARYEIEPLGEIEFKGFAQPQKVFLLLERRETIGTLFKGEMIGREMEQGQLAEFVRPIFSGQYAGILILYGEPGIGKSRLVHAFQESPFFQDHPAAWALCQTDEILRQPLNPFRYWLRQYFGISVNQGEARNKRSFNLKLSELIAATQDATLADELDRTRSFTGSLLELHWPDSLYEQLDAQERYKNTIAGLTTLLEAESRRQPLVLLIEDIHWLDAESKTFLAGLHQQLSKDGASADAYPIAILATARGQESDSQWSAALAARQINLTGLGPGDLNHLAEHLLSGSLSPALRDLINQRSEGNPFFAEQILHYLQEEGMLLPSAQGWQFTADAPSFLPADVQAILVARLDKLAHEVKEVVQTAAVLGREFELRLLMQMISDRHLPEKVMYAEKENIWFALNEVRYIFRHALLRDAAYQMQVHARLQSLHALALESLERLFQSDLKPHYGEMAYHAEKAGLLEQARKYLRLAAKAAGSAYQNEHGIVYYTRALNLWPPDDLRGKAELLVEREKLYNALADRIAQKQDLDALAALLEMMEKAPVPPQERLALQSRFLIRLANYQETTGELPRSIETSRRAAELARAAGDRSVEGEACLQWGTGLWRTADFAAAVDPLARALALARESGNLLIEGSSLRHLGIAHQNLGDYKRARQDFDDALIIAQRAGHLAGQAMAVNSIGALLTELGEYQAAQAYFEQALNLRRTIGDRRGQFVAINNLGIVHVMLGHYKDARSNLEQVLTFYEQTGDRAGEGEVSNTLGTLAMYCGDFAAAEQNLERSRARSVETGDRMTEALAGSMIGLLLHFEGKEPPALQQVDRSLAVIEEMGFLREKAFALNYKGYILLAMQQIDSADSVFQEAIKFWQIAAEANPRIEAVAGLAKTAALRNRPDEARGAVEAVIQHLGVAAVEPGAELSETCLRPLEGMDAPFQMLLTTYEVLLILGDSRAEVFRQQATRILRLAADRIGDEGMKLAFLENIPFHKKLAELRA